MGPGKASVCMLGLGKRLEGSPHSQAVPCLWEIGRDQDGQYTGLNHRVLSRPTQEDVVIWERPMHVAPGPSAT